MTLAYPSRLSHHQLPTMKAYVVRQGDHLIDIALRTSINADELWNHPRNAELRARREPNLLAPVDILYVPVAHRPSLLLVQGTTNHYRASVPRTPLQITFQAAGKPISDEAFEVHGMGRPVNGRSDKTGLVQFDVPAHVREIDIRFVRLNLVFPVRIGNMDPVEEISGMRKRLEQLGHYQGFEQLDDDVRDRLAIESFQRQCGINDTGILDDATKKALADVYGS